MQLGRNSSATNSLLFTYHGERGIRVRVQEVWSRIEAGLLQFAALLLHVLPVDVYRAIRSCWWGVRCGDVSRKEFTSPRPIRWWLPLHLHSQRYTQRWTEKAVPYSETPRSVPGPECTPTRAQHRRVYSHSHREGGGSCSSCGVGCSCKLCRLGRKIQLNTHIQSHTITEPKGNGEKKNEKSQHWKYLCARNNL